MKVTVRKFNIIEKFSLKYLLRENPDEIPVIWNALCDEVVINTEYEFLWVIGLEDNYFENLIRAFSHEAMHQVIYKLDGYTACRKFERIANSLDLGWWYGW